MEDGAPRLVYNADDGSVIVEAAGPVITVEGIVGELVFERLTSRARWPLRSGWVARRRGCSPT